MFKKRSPYGSMTRRDAQRLMDRECGFADEAALGPTLKRLLDTVNEQAGCQLSLKPAKLSNSETGDVADGYYVYIHPMPQHPEVLDHNATRQALDHAFQAAGIFKTDIRSKHNLAWVSTVTLDAIMRHAHGTQGTTPQAYQWFAAGLKDGVARAQSTQMQRG